MATYDYRCRTCDTRFEVTRGIAEPDAPVDCPRGHGSTTRVWTAVAVAGGRSTPARSTPVPVGASGGGGGCCGGGCCG